MASIREIYNGKEIPADCGVDLVFSKLGSRRIRVEEEFSPGVIEEGSAGHVCRRYKVNDEFVYEVQIAPTLKIIVSPDDDLFLESLEYRLPKLVAKLLTI